MISNKLLIRHAIAIPLIVLLTVVVAKWCDDDWGRNEEHEKAGKWSTQAPIAANKPEPQPAAAPAATPQPQVSNIPPLDSWEGFSDENVGFEVIYPAVDTKVASNPEMAEVKLPDAIGGKQRTFRVDVMSPTDKRLDKAGCAASLAAANSRQVTSNGNEFCLVVINEGAAGSTYGNYVYTTKHGQKVVMLTFIIRYPTSVRVYADCETDAAQAKPQCLELAFNEERDTELFAHILRTLKFTK